MEKRKFDVTIDECGGTCDSELFKKMAKRGDITAEKIQSFIGEVVEITGYALCNISTNDKDFNIDYYATNKGFISTGSEVFRNSVLDYLKDTSLFKIVEVKTKKGKTYKASPVLVNNETGLIVE